MINDQDEIVLVYQLIYQMGNLSTDFISQKKL